MYRRRETLRFIAGYVAVGSVMVLAVTGCDASIAPIDVASGCPEQPLRGPDAWASEPGDQLIDDFEDGDLFLAAVAARNGAWVTGNDESQGTLLAEASSHCAARGNEAGHFSGSGFTDWGANWTAVLRNNNGGTAVPYDGRNYGGISFWAAVGPGATEPFEVPLGITTIDNAWNGGVCSTCMDYYATTVTLTKQWQRQVVHFSDMVQSGFGVPQIAMRKDQLVGFILWPKHQFDIWLDDVRFEL
ncbi:MAG TPA: carbohydrate binding domain-containing protein [Polyangia bacterium]|jgi:hypothetical protein